MATEVRGDERLIRSLRTKHAELDRLITQEERRPLPDSTRLRDLKARRLALKDRIMRQLGE
ncbi:YdcH family protein [Hyphomonas johnsonii]|jgi:hypothetical protein|uniref:DUF465 domain-containing protein n=1 Tax=Hyphomonas johnsonii MHS-2 TaxID=1280950 RepID=A0A059FSH0_9PROT|nr:YdcH family protein [Hyphomonas johnsonii]KCZ93418.1 hypothetical protein HJO_06165 [Hyphomonas johnsonii MHS-2]